METDEFDNLIVSSNEVINKRLVTDILMRFIKISTDGEVLFEGTFFKLDNKRKILIYLLTRKVMKIKNIGSLETEEAGPSEISNQTGIAFGSVTWTVRDLDSKLIKSINGKYYVPNYYIEKIKNLFKEGGI